jgi:Flp pilus assembly protein TadG
MVEFAIVLPLLMLMMIAVFEFGRAWNIYQVMTDAARSGARTAVVADPSVTQDSVVALVRRALGRAGAGAGAAVTVTGFRAGTGTPAGVKIALPYRFAFIRPFMGWRDADASITLVTESIMRNE